MKRLIWLCEVKITDGISVAAILKVNYFIDKGELRITNPVFPMFL